MFGFEAVSFRRILILKPAGQQAAHLCAENNFAVIFYSLLFTEFSYLETPRKLTYFFRWFQTLYQTR